MIRALVLALLVSALVYAVLVMVGDGPEVLGALRTMPPGLIPLMLGLATVSYTVRGLRWGALMRGQGYAVSSMDALYLHFAGQTMGISPGRVGEVLKPALAREITGMPMSRGLPLVFAERVADLIAVCILALGGLSLLGGAVWTVAAALVAIVAGTVVASSGWFHRMVLSFLVRQRWATRYHASAGTISETVRTSLSWRTLVWSVPASVVAWGLEGVAFALCVRGSGFDGLDHLALISVYAVSTIVGAFTFLPAGIGFTEASLAGILMTAGMAASAASAATLVTRVATLWWAVLLGWLAIGTRPALFRRLTRGQGRPAAGVD